MLIVFSPIFVADTKVISRHDFVAPLRYYATFKVRKFESLFYKINTFLRKTTTCIGLQAEQILYVNV